MENRDVNKLLLAVLIKWVRKAGRRGGPGERGGPRGLHKDPG
jgi:hypothetical protein